MKRKPRLLVIGPTPPPHHGIATFMERLLLARELHARFDVQHLDISDRRDLSNLGRFDARNAWLGVRHAGELLLALVHRRPDVVYFEISQNAWAFLRDSLFIILPNLFGARVATRLNGSDFRNFFERSRAPVRALIRATLARVDGVAVLGERLRDIFAGLVPAERVSVVPNGTADAFAGSDAPNADDRGGEFTVTYLGALYRPKGILDFVEAARRMREQGSRARFVMAGAWFCDDTRTDVLARVRLAGLTAAVSFPGVVAGDAKLALLRSSDVLVFPGIQNEGQPYVILEAMAAGLPVVSTPKGAIEDMVRDGVNGFIVPDRTPAALAAALLRLEADPALRRRLGAAGRHRYRAHFTDERTIETLVGWLAHVTRGAASRTADTNVPAELAR
jgi:glycosyltransferase involved in cell wall biosynthesis